MLVGLDVDCLVGSATVGAYQAVVRERPDVLWSGPTTYLPATARDCDPTDLDALDDPHPARPSPARGTHWVGESPDHFWSLSFAVHATAWTTVGGFCERYAGYGAEDTDLAHTWQHSGRPLGWVGDARTYHQHHPTQEPPVQHLDDILRNGAIFAERWGRWPMGGWLVRVRDTWARRADPGWWLGPQPSNGDGPMTQTAHRRPGEVQDGVLVASVPANHVYVHHIAPRTPDGVERLPDPDPDDPRRSTQEAWWPPVMLDPDWIAAADFDVFHLQFGFDAWDPNGCGTSWRPSVGGTHPSSTPCTTCATRTTRTAACTTSSSTCSSPPPTPWSP